MSEPLAFTISEACKAAAISRTELYRRFDRGELVPRKRGSRTIVLADDLRQWLASLPTANIQKAA